MEPNDPYKATNGFSQPTVTPPPATSNESLKFEGIGRLFVENEQLKKRIAELEKEAKDEKYKLLYYEKCEECDEAKKENKLLKDENSLLKLQLDNGIPYSDFRFIYDVMDFDKKMKSDDVEKLMDICLELAETKLPREYLIKDSMDVVPIYILLAEKNVFRKHGNSEKDTKNWGLVTLCDCWNNNVVARITDEKRRNELRCDVNKIKRAINNEPWKDSASCSWRGLYDKYDNSNGRNSRKKAKLGRAVNLKFRLEKLLEQIPTLKSRKY